MTSNTEILSRIVANATLFVSPPVACRRRHPLLHQRKKTALDPGQQSSQVEAAEVLVLPGIPLAGRPQQRRRRGRRRRRPRLAAAGVLVEQPVGRRLITMPDMRGSVAVVPLAGADALQARRIDVKALLGSARVA